MSSILWRDGDQSRPQGRLTLECRESFERRQKNVLHHVIDQICVWRESMAGIRVHGVDMGSDELCSCLPVVSEDGRNQFAFVALVRRRFNNVNAPCGRTLCSRIHTVIVAQEGAFPLMHGRSRRPPTNGDGRSNSLSTSEFRARGRVLPVVSLGARRCVALAPTPSQRQRAAQVPLKRNHEEWQTIRTRIQPCSIAGVESAIY